MKIRLYSAFLAVLILPLSFWGKSPKPYIEPPKEVVQASVEIPVPIVRTPELFLLGSITDELANHIIEKLLGFTVAGSESVNIFINSPGGSVDAAQKLVFFMSHLPIKTVCTVDMEAASAAFFILQQCSVRQMTKRAVLMIHNPYFSQITTADEAKLREKADELDVLSNAMIEHYARRMKLPGSEIKERIRKRIGG